MQDAAAESLARTLDSTGDYRVLRRVPQPPVGPPPSDCPMQRHLASGIVLDTETTGLGPDAEVIEVGMVRFAYDPITGTVSHVTGTYSALRDPGRPIPPEVVDLTGITDGAVAGRRIDAREVEAFASGCAIAIAHNSAFDRPVVERAWPVFRDIPWGCSLAQIDWRSEGTEGARLANILAAKGCFHDGHRALDDCLALLHVLGLPLRSARTGLREVLEATGRDGIRLWAVGAPYGAKDALKARGYRWGDGRDGAPRAWNREVPADDQADEIGFLRGAVYRDPAAAPIAVPVGPLERFSPRAGRPTAP